MVSREQLKSIAQNCSAFNGKNKNELYASTGLEGITCENCTHFTSERRCDIDLIDEILIRMTDDV